MICRGIEWFSHGLEKDELSVQRSRLNGNVKVR
jgi:hypothetical protein